MPNSTSTLNSALVAALGELRNVPKDKVNPHFKSRFTSLDAILDATRPVLAKHGLALSQEPVFEDGMAGVVTRIIHAGGESRESKLLLPLRDQSAQGVGSCLSYARRYSAAAVLGIASDEDDDGQQASTPTQRTATKPVIEKPAIQPRKPAAEVAPETPKTAVKDPYETMFSLMDAYKISEEDVLAFLKSKGAATPEFIVDLALPVVKRVNEVFADIVAFAKK